MDVRDETAKCARCSEDFTHSVCYRLEYDAEDPDAEPTRRPWAEGSARAPEHCPDCALELEREAEAEREAQERAARFSVDNLDYIRRLKSSGILEPKLWRATLKNYDRTRFPEAYTAARSFVEGVMSGDLGERPWRFFTGPTGGGKTHLMVGIDRALYAMGFKGRVSLLVAPLFVKRIQSGYEDNMADALLEEVRRSDVVLVDDLGRGRQTDDKASIMNELLCLLAGKPVAMSSNFTRAGLEERNPEFMTLASRLGPASCWTVELNDRDRRDDPPTPAA